MGRRKPQYPPGMMCTPKHMAIGELTFPRNLRRAFLTMMIEHSGKQDRAQDYFALSRKRSHFRPLQPRERGDEVEIPDNIHSGLYDWMGLRQRSK
jgi:hypothetical protein